MIDAGADIVFGHGPHVTRAVELYKNRLIIYSLGNFLTYARFNLKSHKGIAPLIKIFIDKKGEFKKGKILSIYQQAGFGPIIDKKKRAIKEIIELTNKDFPETGLKIDDDGIITMK